VSATAGSTGRRGVFLWTFREWVQLVASYNRAFDWAGSTAGLTHQVKTAVVSSTNPSHQSARVGASIHSRWVPTLRIDSSDDLDSIITRLNNWQPEMLIAYASMVRLLAEAQLTGRLMIMPRLVFSASEVLTDSTRKLATKAWGRSPYNVYAATETSSIAAECGEHTGMHLFEDLVITEVVDADNQPVPPGEYGAKVLVTVLFSRTVPLIRYEMSDRSATGGQSPLSMRPPVCADYRNPGPRAGITDFPHRGRSGSGRATDRLPPPHGRGSGSRLADPTDRHGARGSPCSAARGRHINAGG
jgi:phenylacetate-CoA ligase